MHAARHPCKKHAALLFMCMSLPADAASMLTGELKKILEVVRKKELHV